MDFDRRIMRLRVTKNGKARNAYIIDDDVYDALRTLPNLGRPGVTETHGRPMHCEMIPSFQRPKTSDVCLR